MQGSISMLLVIVIQNKTGEQLVVIDFKIDRKLEGKKKKKEFKTLKHLVWYL